MPIIQWKGQERQERSGDGFALSIVKATEEMKDEQGELIFLENINLAELERRSNVSCEKLRRLK